MPILTLDEIYRRYLDMVFRIASRYCRDREEAEDVTQDTFLAIDRKLGSFRGDAKLSTWIYRVATNRCLDHLRMMKSRNKLHKDYLDSMVVRNLNSGGDRELAKIDLERILSQLLPMKRQILFLTLAEGLSYFEAAEVLGLTESAVSKTVSRFLKRFRSRNKAAKSNPESRVAA